MEIIPSCPPDCKLCAIEKEAEMHYDNCAECKNNTEFCPPMKVIMQRHKTIIIEMFPED